MKSRGPWRVMVCAAVVWTACANGRPAVGQEAGAKPVDRIYSHSQVEVQEALDAMGAFSTERLPTLDGFVSAGANTLDHFENPHYQLHIDIVSQGMSQTLVSVGAKITAWYVSDDPGHSQYVIIPSNGRIENDFLDRLSIYLEKGSSPRAVAAAASGAGGAGTMPVPDHSAGGPTASGAEGPMINTADPAVLGSEIASLRAKREGIEAQERNTREQIDQLTSVSKNQKFLSSIAVVRSSQTPVFSMSDETSKILFYADPDDEFEMTEGREGFVQVKLENGTTGWIRVSQLRRPSDPDDPDATGNSNFTTANEQVKVFDGDWAPLKGKPTLFVFAEPSRTLPEGTLGRSQMEFAKQVFIDGYREANHTDEPAAGVVIVFLGEKGGVAAASLADIRRWRDGFLTDKAFLDRCSFDPPTSFRDTP
ncbi:MAG TPA: hypothetical protein VMJ93_09880 [Verrucomicrobiae bacterium]|nr:hypothetical protein [Verrucomicrobiae bacterium]